MKKFKMILMCIMAVSEIMTLTTYSPVYANRIESGVKKIENRLAGIVKVALTIPFIVAGAFYLFAQMGRAKTYLVGGILATIILAVRHYIVSDVESVVK